MNEANHLIDPELSLQLVKVLSWILIVLGVAKMVLYAIGEWIPSAYTKVKSETAKKFLTGSGNRFLFGLGGFITLLLGVGGLALGYLFAHLFGVRS